MVVAIDSDSCQKRSGCAHNGGSLSKDHDSPPIVINALTVDVEDYFHVSAFEGSIRRADWAGFQQRVVNNTNTILDLLDEHKTKGTFFVLGWVAEEHPGLVPAIHGRGHEIACHGYGHELVNKLGPKRFREDIRRAKALLEDQCGARVSGYRAPSFSIVRESLWALDVLLEEGFRYDSSVFPIRHDVYGIPGAYPHPHRIACLSGEMAEFPLSTVGFRFLGRTARFPVAGGGYLRLLPLVLFEKAIARINAIDRQPAVLYFHPWELDPEQPRIRARLKSRFRHYTNLATTLGKVRALVSRFRFAPMVEVLGRCGHVPADDCRGTP